MAVLFSPHNQLVPTLCEPTYEHAYAYRNRNIHIEYLIPHCLRLTAGVFLSAAIEKDIFLCFYRATLCYAVLAPYMLRPHILLSIRLSVRPPPGLTSQIYTYQYRFFSAYPFYFVF